MERGTVLPYEFLAVRDIGGTRRLGSDSIVREARTSPNPQGTQARVVRAVPLYENVPRDAVRVLQIRCGGSGNSTFIWHVQGRFFMVESVTPIRIASNNSIYVKILHCFVPKCR